MNYTITDNNADHTATGTVDETIDCVRAWFPEAPQEVFNTIEKLRTALTANQPYEAYTAYLDIEVK